MKLGIARRYPTAEDVLENNIADATNVCFVSQYAFGESSTNLRQSLEPRSGLARDSFGSSSTVFRQAAEAQSKGSRTAPEQESKRSRTSVEAESNNTRRAVEQHPTGSRTNSREIQSKQQRNGNG